MNEWQSIKGMGMVELSGRCAMLRAGPNGAVEVLVEIERKWWEFWKPKLYWRWISFQIDT